MRRWWAAMAVGAVTAIAIFACRAPTQITLRLTTDVDCSIVANFKTSVFGTASDPITTTGACRADAPPHVIGSLVLTPSGANDERVTVSAVLGVTRFSETCASNGYRGCIIGRRRLRFAPHAPLELPIALDRVCLDVPCGEEETCAVGRCVPADIEDPKFCTDAECGALAPPPVDGAAEVASDGAPDAPAVVDVGDGGFVFGEPLQARATTAPVRGLVDDGDAGVWWTERLGKGTSIRGVVGSPVVGDAATQNFNLVGVYRGIAAFPDHFAAAVEQSPIDGVVDRIERSNGGVTTECIQPGGGFGVGVARLQTVVGEYAATTLSDGRVIACGVSLEPLATLPADLATGYIESEDDRFLYWPSAGRITSYALTGGGFGSSPIDAGALPSSATPYVGFALSVRAFYVANREGRILAVNRSTGTWTELVPAGRLTEVEDLMIVSAAVSIRARSLFVATASGIWSVKVVEPP